MKRIFASLGVLFPLLTSAAYHDGPPFPIIVDQSLGERTISVWADPDVGVGTFYLYVPEEKDGQLSRDTPISVWVQPADKHLAEAQFFAEPAEEGANYQRIAYVDFDDRGMWETRFVVEDSDSELVKEVDVTPPGSTGYALLWFLTPFLLVALLWAKAMHQRVQYARAQQPS